MLGPSYKIAVIGVGLIGGSIVRAFQKAGHYLIAIDHNEKTLQYARDHHIGDLISDHLAVIQDVDFVFIATPINDICSVVQEVTQYVSPQCCITDVGSIKSEILETINRTLPELTHFIGGHPMAGTANNGIEFSQENMFQGAKWILCHTQQGMNPFLLNNLKALLLSIGAEPVEISHDLHDQAVAITIGLPYLLSYSLYHLVQSLKDTELQSYVKLLAATGFRDSTRLATTSPELGSFLLKLNRKEYLEQFIEYFKDLSNQQNPLEQLRCIASDRSSLYSLDGKNIFKLGS